MKHRILVRDGVIASIRDYLSSGLDVDLVGRRGSGRSTILKQLAQQMRHAGWSVLHLEPISVPETSELSTLNHAVRGLRLDEASGSETINLRSLERLADSGKLIVLFDDWAAIEEGTWSVIERLRRSRRVPVVAAHTLGPIPTDPPRSLPGTPGYMPVTVRVPPFSIDELRSLLADVFDGPIAPFTLSRIYAKSGGLPSLGLAIALVSKVEGRIVENDGVWTADGDLWSDALEGIARQQLEGLDARQIDALSQLSAVGLIEVEEALQLLPRDLLEGLEFLNFVQTNALGKRRWISVNPPILAEYFRNDGYGVRAYRRSKTLNQGEAAVRAARSAEVRTLDLEPPAPLFFRLALERFDADVASMEAVWRESPTMAAALSYLSVLNEAGAPRQTIEKVLKTASSSPGSPEDLARLRVWQASWRANVEHDLEAALELLSQDAGLGPYARLLEGAAVSLQVYFAQTDPQLLERLQETPDLPLSVRQDLMRHRLHLLVVLGRFDKAWAELKTLSLSPEESLPFAFMPLCALVMLGRGDFTGAVLTATAAFDRARDELDVASLRAVGHILGLLMIVRGQHSSLNSLGEALLGLGHEPYLPKAVTLGILCSQTRGQKLDASAVTVLLTQAEALGIPDGPLPGMSRWWGRARLLELTEGLGPASDALWESALSARARGQMLVACVDGLTSLERHFVPERYALIREWLVAVQSPLLAAQALLVGALARRDVAVMLEAAEDLTKTGLVGQTLTAYSAAAEFAREKGEAEWAERIEEIGAEFMGGLEPGIYAVSTLGPTQQRLTGRERDVSELVASGRTNQQIADQLVLSVRTVENHIHRAMRKAGVDTRRQLGLKLPFL